MVQTRTTSTPVEAASAAAAARLWAPAQAGELARQNLLQRQRLLDAEDMGLVAVADPRDLQTDRDESPICAHTAKGCSAVQKTT